MKMSIGNEKEKKNKTCLLAKSARLLIANERAIEYVCVCLCACARTLVFFTFRTACELYLSFLFICSSILFRSMLLSLLATQNIFIVHFGKTPAPSARVLAFNKLLSYRNVCIIVYMCALLLVKKHTEALTV